MHPALEIPVLGLALSVDSFSAAFALGNRPFSRRNALTFATASGSAEALSAWLGAGMGTGLRNQFASIDHWVAFGLLTAVAVHMAWEGVQELRGSKEETGGTSAPFHGFLRILVVSFSTSLDALGVGVGLGLGSSELFPYLIPYLISIGGWAFLSTLAGLGLAKRISDRAGPWMSFLGAAVLELIAVQMLRI